MIYIKIEIWPGGDNTRARILSEGIIHNTGGDRSKGDYEYLFSKVGGFRAPPAQIFSPGLVKNVLRRGRVTGFPRLRLYAHDLLLRALISAFGARNASPELFDTEVTLASEDRE